MQTIYTALLIIGCIALFSTSVVLINYYYGKFVASATNQSSKLFDYEIKPSAIRQLYYSQSIQRANKLNEQINVLRIALKMKRKQYKQALHDTTAGCSHSAINHRVSTSLSDSRKLRSSQRVHYNEDTHRTNNAHHIKRRRDFIQRREILQLHRQNSYRQSCPPATQSINSNSVQYSHRSSSHTDSSSSIHKTTNSTPSHNLYNDTTLQSITLPGGHSRHQSREHIRFDAAAVIRHNKRQHNKQHHTIDLPSDIQSISDDSDTINTMYRKKIQQIKSTYKQPKHKLYRRGERNKSSHSLHIVESIDNQQRNIVLGTHNGFEPTLSTHSISSINDTIQFDDISDTKHIKQVLPTVSLQPPKLMLNTYMVNNNHKDDNQLSATPQHSTQSRSVKIVPFSLSHQLQPTNIAG